MLIRWCDFNEPEDQARLDRLDQAVQALSKRSPELGFEQLRRGIEALGYGLSLESMGKDSLSLVYAETRRHALASRIAESWSGSPRLSPGRFPVEYEKALSVAMRYGVNLSTSRVRVGFTRGHLMDVVVQIPLDVAGDEETLQVAAEVFLEQFLGDELLDCWIASVGVDRTARTRGLLMFSDSQNSAESHPLSLCRTLVERGMLAVVSELPHSLLQADATRTWTALSMAPPVVVDASVLPQPDRVFASTAYPEALKASLEGLPFCSSRFTQGPELFGWLRYNGQKVGDRIKTRTLVEEIFQKEVAECSGGDCRFVLAGTGFGPVYDYVDVWLLPEPKVVATLGERVASVVGDVQLGFYDNRLDEVLLFRGTQER